MVRWYFLAFLIFVTTVCVAQSSVEGVVRTSAGEPVSAAQVSITHAGAAAPAEKTVADANGRFHFSAVNGGQYVIRTEAQGFFTRDYQMVLPPRETVSLTIELAPKTTVTENVEVTAQYQTIDPGRTGSSQTFSHEQLERLMDPMAENTSNLVANLMPGASQSHDNFINVRGNEFSLHEFINGVSFLDNTQPQFSPGVSPQIFETVDLVTGGFTSEYGNRFGGILDITTRSGRTMNGHGLLNYRGATLDNHDLNADYGGQAGAIGYYFFADGFTSGRYLDPPEPEELHDFGKGLRGAAQFDGQHGRDTFKL